MFTIGHSTRPVDELIRLLREAEVRQLVDVRLFPRSRVNPQFNIDTLPAELAAAAIAYDHIAALGGRRPRQNLGIPSPNGFWRNDSFRNYADYALTPPFREGLHRLMTAALGCHSAIMCAEAAWQRCHRQIITDWLIAAGRPVRHILAPGRTEPARLNTAATVQADGTVHYPPSQPILDL